MARQREIGRFETHHIDLQGFGHRRYRLFSPPESSDNESRPLLLMFDGQNVFDDDGSYSGGWYAHRAILKLSKQRLRPFVVGIDHGGEKRIDELAPFPTRWGHGRAEDFIGGIASQLLPRLRKQLPLVPGPAGVLLAGSSMGGLAALYGHLRHPDVFGGALSMSPSLSIGGPRLAELARSASKPVISQIYLDCGPREGPETLRRFGEMIRVHGYSDEELRVRVDPKGSHNERCWRRRLPAALRFFYK